MMDNPLENGSAPLQSRNPHEDEAAYQDVSSQPSLTQVSPVEPWNVQQNPQGQQYPPQPVPPQLSESEPHPERQAEDQQEPQSEAQPEVPRTPDVQRPTNVEQPPSSIQKAQPINEVVGSAIASAKQNKIVAEVIDKTNLKRLLTGGILGIVGVFVVAILTALVAMVVYNDPHYVKPLLQRMGFVGIFAIALFGSFATHFHINIGATGHQEDFISIRPFIDKIQIISPLGLGALLLLLGCAFGVYRASSKLTMSMRSLIASSAVGALAISLIFQILSLFLRARVQAPSYGVTAALSATGLHSLIMVFLFALVGFMGGYFMAQLRPGAPNVFVAASDLAHRARGFVRTSIEFFGFYLAVSFVLMFVYSIIGVFTGKSLGAPLFAIIGAPFLAAMGHQLGSLGLFHHQISGVLLQWIESDKDSTKNINNFNNTQLISIWFKVFLLVVFIVLALYLAMRLAARNTYDKKYAGWEYAWQAPVIVLVAVTVGNLLFNVIKANIGVTVEVSLLPINGIILCVWMVAIEVIARTIGTNLIATIPQFWKYIVGGTVRVGAFKVYEPKVKPAAKSASSSTSQPSQPQQSQEPQETQQSQQPSESNAAEHQGLPQES